MFNYDLVDVPMIEARMTAEGRVYETPDGNQYPSVTTVLGNRPEKKKSLAEWRKRIGEKQATEISTQAARRGTSVHRLVEEYLIDLKEPDQNEMPTAISSFNSIKKSLDVNLEVIRGIEVPLYSDRLKLAGRCDCVGKWSGKNSIIDFKTSKKLKKESWIEEYFLQCTAYSLMFEERTKIVTEGIVIIISVDDYKDPQVFMKSRNGYISALEELVKDQLHN
jgi:ATP-dependent exoDNAse (exonuclease V) beta subunit